MSGEVPVDFAFEDNATLESLEEGIREIGDQIKLGHAFIAVALGRVKKDKLYLKVAVDFKRYLELERLDLSYQRAIYLADIGEKYIRYKPQLQANGIRLYENMSKIRLLESEIVENDPVWWKRMKKNSVRELKDFIEKRKSSIDVSTEPNDDGIITVSNSSLYLNREKIRGINLKEFKKNAHKGKRAVVIWVDDDQEARKVRKKLKKIHGAETD